MISFPQSGTEKKIYRFPVAKSYICVSYCVKNVQIESFFWSVFCRTRAEYGPEKNPHLNTLHAVVALENRR